MSIQKKILVLGATGAMGQYLVPKLAQKGYLVDAVSLADAESSNPNIRYIKTDIFKWENLEPLLANKYDAIVDFMIYNSWNIPFYLPLYVRSTGHYIYLSSYRIYDGKDVPITENARRLLDSSEDVLLRNSDDYSIYKARGENVMRSFEKKNWTIIRPAITYSYMRSQLVTLEIDNTVGRAFAGKPVAVPEAARNVQATMSWAGDVAEMILRLLFNDKAYGETFTVATAEHHTWGEIADYYKEICGLKAVWIDTEDYIKMLSFNETCMHAVRWQLVYDRLFDRVIDNSKILNVTGLTQAGLKPLFDGLKYEISRLPKDHKWNVNWKMDEYFRQKGLL